MLRPSEKGSKTEIAALKLIEQAGFNYEAIRESSEITHKYPFSSKRKRMSVIVNIPGNIRRIYVKGASEMVLASCTQWRKKSND